MLHTGSLHSPDIWNICYQMIDSANLEVSQLRSRFCSPEGLHHCTASVFQRSTSCQSSWCPCGIPWLLQHRDPSPSTSWPSVGPASSLYVPFNLPALVYIASVTIGVLLAAIMKGTDLICCFLSLLLLQATAGKAFDQCFAHTLVDYVSFRVLDLGNTICLHPNPACWMKVLFGLS